MALEAGAGRRGAEQAAAVGLKKSGHFHVVDPIPVKPGGDAGFFERVTDGGGKQHGSSLEH